MYAVRGGHCCRGSVKGYFSICQCLLVVSCSAESSPLGLSAGFGLPAEKTWTESSVDVSGFSEAPYRLRMQMAVSVTPAAAYVSQC